MAPQAGLGISIKISLKQYIIGVPESECTPFQSNPREWSCSIFHLQISRLDGTYPKLFAIWPLIFSDRFEFHLNCERKS